MTGNFDAAPGAQDGAFAIDHEAAAFDAAYLLAVHILHFDHPEQVAGLLFGIGEQVEREFVLRFEIFMRLEAVARDAVDAAAELDELRMQLAKLDALGGAARRVVLGIEVYSTRNLSLACDSWNVLPPVLGREKSSTFFSMKCDGQSVIARRYC